MWKAEQSSILMCTSRCTALISMAACCRQMSSAAAEAEKLKAAGDAHKRDLAHAPLLEREAELASVREKLWAANRETSSEPPATSCRIQEQAAHRLQLPLRISDATAAGPELHCCESEGVNDRDTEWRCCR